MNVRSLSGVHAAQRVASAGQRIWLLSSLLAALAIVAWLSPNPNRSTDRGVYEHVAQSHIVQDCSEIHCFRVLVPWTLGSLPGRSLFKWKAYAVVCNAAAAIAVFNLSLTFGLSRRGARFAALVAALGYGSLYTLHDPFTADPLMYALGPIMTFYLLQDRVTLAGVAATIGVLAKEFAAAPLWIVTVWAASLRDLHFAMRVLVWANLAFLTWLALQLVLIIRFNYSYGGSPSADLLGGGYLTHWLSRQTVRSAVSAIFDEFGALYLLAPAGVALASRPVRRLALISLPVAAVFAYVQQPDRALWNFHFLVAPLGALVLERAAAWIAWGVITSFIVANLRLGSQLPWVPASRYALFISIVLAIGAVLSESRHRSPVAAVAATPYA